MTGKVYSLRLKLAAATTFEDGEKGSIIASVKRGEATTRFTLKTDAYEFVKLFASPKTLHEAATELSAQGFQYDSIITFGKQMLKTPLFEFHDDVETYASAEAAMQFHGFKLIRAFKDRKFDGVYLVEDKRGQQQVIKLIKCVDEDGETDRISHRIRCEHEILKAIEPSGVAVKANEFQSGDYPYFGMEYFHSISLTSYLKQTLSLPARLALCRGVIKSIAVLHAEGYVHGDIHTSNFLVNEQGTLKLIDLDCAFKPGGAYTPRIGGAPHFLPPERTMSHWHEGFTTPATTQADVYQIGIMLYVLLTGWPPFSDRHFGPLMEKIRTGEYRQLTQTKEGESVPEDVVALVSACMHIEPEKRPVTAERVYEWLGQHVA